MDTQDLQKLKNKFDIIGNDAALNMALEIAVKVAPVDITVLVSGESGVGKENIPRIIHQNSKRKNNKYFAVNCGAIPEGTIDSELFGHEKGSFTGAIESRKGYFEEANGGTLFLDEIGELPLSSQAKLLRVLQSGEYIKVGSSKVEKTDVRVIAATNRNLEFAVAKGKFREDLYYRLNAVQIIMPPLRERMEDIPILFRKFASDFSEKNQRRKISLSLDATKTLVRYRWPGNVRQLKNVAEVVAALEAPEINTQTAERFEISSETLLKYMPEDNTNSLPVRVQNPQDSISESDKMKIFELLHNLTSEVNRLKSIVETKQIPDRPPLPAPSMTPDTISTPMVRPQEMEVQTSATPMNAQEVDIQEPGMEEHETYSLKENYIELIKKSLERHNGNRRKAAEELGISERTLYRKLSQAHTDENNEK